MRRSPRQFHMDGKISVPAGGLFYASSTTEDARPLMRDPFLILGEEAYLLSLKTILGDKNGCEGGAGRKGSHRSFRISDMVRVRHGSLWKTLWGVSADSAVGRMADRIADFHFLPQAGESE